MIELTGKEKVWMLEMAKMSDEEINLEITNAEKDIYIGELRTLAMKTYLMCREKSGENDKLKNALNEIREQLRSEV